MAASAAGATYAGEADPYRKPHEADELEDLDEDADDAVSAERRPGWSSSTSRPG